MSDTAEIERLRAEVERLRGDLKYLIAQLQDSRLEAAYWERQAHRE